MAQLTKKPEAAREVVASVYCPICTHTVEARVLLLRRSALAVPGQKCPRCQSLLDAGYVMTSPQAA